MNVVDNSPEKGKSKLKFPGVSAKCGQNDFGAATAQKVAPAGSTVTVTFKSAQNNGHAQFKLLVTSFAPVGKPKRKEKFCPAVKESGCPAGPCCKGPDCCELTVGTETAGNIKKIV